MVNLHHLFFFLFFFLVNPHYFFISSLYSGYYLQCTCIVLEPRGLLDTGVSDVISIWSRGQAVSCEFEAVVEASDEAP